MNISVAMAVYNGEKYLDEQVQSIMSQLDEKDELVISYNESKDHTLDLLKQYAKYDKRTSYYLCKEIGVLPNFENAISNCKNEIIFLSDQDDIWASDKVSAVLDVFQKDIKINVVFHDSYIYEGKPQEIYTKMSDYRQTSVGFWKNLKKNSYTGCCMAFRKSFTNQFLPFPQDIPMHDQWIGLLADKTHSSYYLDEPLVFYRRHQDNSTGMKHLSFMAMIKNRWKILNEINKRVKGKSYE